MNLGRLLPLVMWLIATGLQAEEALTLEQAERTALARDVSAPAIKARAQALSEAAVAAGELPDPKLKLGMMNLPTDSFSRSQEAMTQLQVGVRQAIPPRGTLEARREGMEARSRAEALRAEATRRKVLREVRQAWLEVWYQVEGGRIVDDLRTLFEQLVVVTRDYYAAGRKNQQDVLRAQVELSLLDDRRTRFRTEEEAARAALARWIGEGPANRPLSREFPALPPLPDRASLRAALARHPEVLAANARIEAAQKALAEARARYRPGLMFDVTYGNRVGNNPDGSSRADFLSAMVSLDLPLFTKNRQDRTFSARRQEFEAARLVRDDLIRRLEKSLDADLARLGRLDERIRHYDRKVLPETAQNAEASLAAYRSGVTDFTGLMRARLTELDSRLMALRLRVDRAKAQARLLYLASRTGEDS